MASDQQRSQKRRLTTEIGTRVANSNKKMKSPSTNKIDTAPSKQNQKGNNRSNSSILSGTEADVLIREIVEDLKTNVSQIDRLIRQCSSKRPEKSSEDPAVVAASSLQSIFAKLPSAYPKLFPSIRKEKISPNDESILKQLKEKRNTYIQSILQDLIGSDHAFRQAVGLDLYLKALLHSNKLQTSDITLTFLLEAMVKNTNLAPMTVDVLRDRFLNTYDDLRYFALHSLTGVISRNLKTNDQKFAHNCFIILRQIELPENPCETSSSSSSSSSYSASPSIIPNKKDKKEEEAAEDTAVYQSAYFPSSTFTNNNEPNATLKSLRVKAHRKEFNDCWLKFLQLPSLSKSIHKAVLMHLPSRVVSNLIRPQQLLDFFTDSYNNGEGVIPLLALNGLFILITKYNLDYPDFYRKLYKLLEPSIFHVKFRNQFLRLLNLFLSSTLLPAYLVAAFIKRLARLALSAPPAGCIFIMPFIFNLLCKHPSVQVLIHRKANHNTPQPVLLLSGANGALSSGVAESQMPGFDPYSPQEEDPSKCGALESSLWEIETLKNHYEPTISQLAQLLERKLNRAAVVDMNEFFDYSYQQQFDKEVRSKKRTALNYQYETKVFEDCKDSWSL